jgi:sporulation protein YlmC with PRC-barrel domain
MSIRTSLSLAVAAALIAAGLSYGQQTSGVQAPRETAQQSDQRADPQPSAARRQSTLDRRFAERDPQQPINRQDQTGQQAQEREAGYRGESARAAQGRTLRLSEIMDMEVRNAQDEDLGSIEDVVVEAESGKIRYAAVSVGGFLGVGDRLIAVPWQSLRIQQAPNDDDKYVLLNADRAKIENAPGFNEENWPDFGNQRFSEEVDVYYGDSAERRTTTGVRSSTTERRSTSNVDSPRDTQSPRGTRSTNGATDTQNRQDTGTDTR